MISDLGSMNGTRVNGWRLTGPARLRPGDEVGFGNSCFIAAAP
jgi:pSer/pThr/pTyr-binding forkhead associated (FHA) protein